MVSSLWKACSDGDLQKVLELLNEPAVDVELKDHAGITPLIEAVKNSHVDVVRALLDRGANATNPSSQGHLPEHYTSERAILDLLHPPQNETLLDSVSPHQPVYHSESAGDLGEPFYTPPPGAFPYFPTINTSISSGNEGGVYYPSSQSQSGGNTATPNSPGNLPPPEIARMIPCRYFPACRYGAQCIFAHPQTPYYPAPISPLHYPPYDPIGNPFMHSYYHPPPPSFRQPDHHLTPLSPPPPGPSLMHTRSPSEVVSPSQGHFSQNGAPSVPYGSISSPVYPHSGQMPAPISMPLVLPLHHPISHTQPGPQSHNIYNASTSPVLPFVLHQDLPGPSAPPAALNYPDIAPSVKLPPEQTEIFNTHPREANRRGAGRRPSVGSRKPPCLFFPAGRCKNGNDCRFPHILTDNATMPTPSLPPLTRGGGPRPRSQMNGHNGFPTVETKLGAMTIRDDAPRPKNAFEVTGQSHANEVGSRPRYPQGSKNQQGGSVNGSHLHRKIAAPKPQRVPNPDEFPVLAGTITPPSRPSGLNGVWVNGNGHAGPTAAQILQAPPTVRKEGNKEHNMQDTTPDATRNLKDANAEVNSVPRHEQAPAYHINTRPAMSFAAATSGPTDVSKEVSVSA